MNQSHSGYDFSIACKLLDIGIADTDVIATILAHRPQGYEERSRKGPAYLRRTITNALARHHRSYVKR